MEWDCDFGTGWVLVIVEVVVRVEVNLYICAACATASLSFYLFIYTSREESMCLESYMLHLIIVWSLLTLSRIKKS